MIIIMAGLPGTGKSTLSKALASELSGVVLDKDVIRAALFPASHIEYTTSQDDFCQEIMLETAAHLLGKQPELAVFLDGRTFSRAYQRLRAIDFCRQQQTRWALVECVCSEQTALERVSADHNHLAANRTPGLYRQLKESWEPIADPRLVIDTDQSLDSCIARALPYITGRPAMLRK